MANPRDSFDFGKPPRNPARGRTAPTAASNAQSMSSVLNTYYEDSSVEDFGTNAQTYRNTQANRFSVQEPARHRHATFVPRPDSKVEMEEYKFDDGSDFSASIAPTPDLNKSDSPTVPNATHAGPDVRRKKTVMKIHRWGTKRNPQGQPISIKRSFSMWNKKETARRRSRRSSVMDSSSDVVSGSPDAADSADVSEESSGRPERTIFFNTPLEPQFLDEDGQPAQQYPRNKIRTTKYTPLSFIPKNLVFQFRNVANVYFLFCVILGAFPVFGVDSAGMAAVPLIVIVSITALKDAVEDYRRTILDIEVNNSITHILSGVPNPNVGTDSVSLWRRFKKKCTRATVATARFIRRRPAPPMPTDVPLDDLASRVSAQFSEYRPDGTDIENENADPFADPDEASVIDVDRPATGTARFRRGFWKDLKVGDIVRVHNNDEIPADLAILATADADGACYVETKNLDGETNLKVRQALKSGARLRHAADFERAAFRIESEAPQPNLYTYRGLLRWGPNNELSEPIGITNTLLRGCKLRNTKWVLGVVLFTGPDTKIMLNAGETPSKRSRIARELNFSVVMNFGLLFILCLVSGLVAGFSFNWTATSASFFEFTTGSAANNGVISFFTGIILYQSLVPISLYISIEIIKTLQAFFIYSDVGMYYPALDYPCTPKSWNISDDLGQIEYIFSDKTGTLTQNVMEFKKCTVAGKPYGLAYTEAYAGLRRRAGADVAAEAEEAEQAIQADKTEMIRLLRSLNPTASLRPEELTFVSADYARDLRGVSGVAQQEAAAHFMHCLAVCHSVLAEPSPNDPTRLEFKAQSPDEAALVGTARDLGFEFTGRTKRGVRLSVQGEPEEVQVLHTLEFNSTRKRMSVIVKETVPGSSEPRIRLICKGADSVIYARLSPDSDRTVQEATALQLEQFAAEGLRTLCVAERIVPAAEYAEWDVRHQAAAAQIENREEAMEAVADALERELHLLGGTAIEDRLQDGVPETIALLAEAGIKLWVLTGDKVETAVNIGFSCNLLAPGMDLLVVKEEGAAEGGESAGGDANGNGNGSGSSDAETSRNSGSAMDSLLAGYLAQYFDICGDYAVRLQELKADHEPPAGQCAVVIDGPALAAVLHCKPAREKFVLLSKLCRAVLCCRVSPAQKAAVVRLVRGTLDVMALAVGDGSNDVAMIQAADVGVGIAGEEGRQAAMAADYAVGQFRFLARLLLVHGRWSYKRLAELIPCFFYKNEVSTFTLFWYGIYTNFDGTYLYEYTYLMFYNLAFTSLPVILLGVFDQDVSAAVSLVVPQLYRTGILRAEWTQRKFWAYMADGLWQSAVCFFVPFLLYWLPPFIETQGLQLDHRYYVGLVVTVVNVCAVNLYVLMHQYRWDWLSVLIAVISCLAVFVWTLMWSAGVHSEEIFRMGVQMFGAAAFWAVSAFGIAACVLPRFVIDVTRRIYWPQDVDVIREQVAAGRYAGYPEEYDPTDPAMKRLGRQLEGVAESRASGGGTPEMMWDKPGSNEAEEAEDEAGETEGEVDDLAQLVTHPTHPLRHSLASDPRRSEERMAQSEIRRSLEATRATLAEAGVLPEAFPVTRTSVEFPELTRAETLMSLRSQLSGGHI